MKTPLLGDAQEDSRMITLKQLNKEYAPPGGRMIEITDREEIARQKESKTSCCWCVGERIADTGWIGLAYDRPNRFVCRAENFD